MYSMPCYTDSDADRFPEEVEEDTDPRTESEKRISWICSDWADAIACDNYDEWYGVRMSIYGAIQTLIHSHDRWDDYKAMQTLGKMAFENSLVCLRAGRYEGAA